MKRIEFIFTNLSGERTCMTSIESVRSFLSKGKRVYALSVRARFENGQRGSIAKSLGYLTKFLHFECILNSPEYISWTKYILEDDSIRENLRVKTIAQRERLKRH